jgi:hypothetical protein
MFVGRSAVILTLAFAAVCLPVAAQDLPTVEVVTLDLTPYVQPGKQIRISGEALRRVGGRVLSVSRDTIFLADAGSSGGRPIPLSQVDTLWSRGNWLLPGIAVGTSAGVLVGGAVCVFGSHERCKALPIGAAAGLVAGYVFGKTRTVWQRRYARRDGGPVPSIGHGMDLP